MSNLWNQINLEPPFVSSYRTSPKEINIKPLREIFKEASSFFHKQHFLRTETALLSRCIYRTKTKFRSDKGNKELQKLNRALLQYLRTNFPYHVDNFTETLPDEEHSGIFYLPTKNLLDYILVRLQGVAKLMCRAAECAKQAAKFLEARIAMGQLWTVAFICFAVVSRIWVLVVEIMKFCCKFFDVAVEYSCLLKNTTSQWLSGDYVFPKCLREWLNVCWFDEAPYEKNIEKLALHLDVEMNEESALAETSTISLRGFNAPDAFETIEDRSNNSQESMPQKKKRKHEKFNRDPVMLTANNSLASNQIVGRIKKKRNKKKKNLENPKSII